MKILKVLLCSLFALNLSAQCDSIDVRVLITVDTMYLESYPPDSTYIVIQETSYQYDDQFNYISQTSSTQKTAVLTDSLYPELDFGMTVKYEILEQGAKNLQEYFFNLWKYWSTKRKYYQDIITGLTTLPR
jgi:hypothetical protein